ncbi:MAG: type II toxin-antitoxin system RelE family toxin [Bdellovibrionales bacterium]
MKRYTVTLKKSAQKELKKLPKNIQNRILAALIDLQSNPKPKNSIKMEGEHHLRRLRVGDYRVIYTLIDMKCVVKVIRIRHRQGAYKS